MEKYKRVGFSVLLLGLLLCLIYILIKYVLVITLPFVIAFIIVCSFRKIVVRINKKTKIPQPVVVFVLSLLTLGALIVVLATLAYGFQGLIEALKQELAKENNIFTTIMTKIQELEGKSPFLKKLDKDGQILPIFDSLLGDLLKKCSLVITSFFAKLPSIILTTIITVMALFYLSKDYDRLNSRFKQFLPKKAYCVSVILKNNLISIFGKYLKSYFFLCIVTFAQLFSGFLILNVSNAAFIALLISLLDMLPLLGSGTILVVWGVIMLVCDNVTLGIGLLAIGIIAYVVRQILEPRLLSSQMDVHPLITLFFMYTGFKIFGVLGMIFAPFIPFAIKPIVTFVKKTENTVDNENKLC